MSACSFAEICTHGKTFGSDCLSLMRTTGSWTGPDDNDITHSIIKEQPFNTSHMCG